MILPDVRGLYRFYEELALRFAERGYTALAFDYFGRTAGAEKRDDTFDTAAHVEAETPEEIQQTSQQRSSTCARCRRLGTDLHRRLLFGRPPLVARRGGGPRPRRRGRLLRPSGRADGKPGPAQLAADPAPILALQAGADQHITADDNEAFDQALTDAGVEHELVDLRRRAAQLLRSQARGVRRRLRRRLGAGARLHRAPRPLIREARSDEAESLAAIQRDASLAGNAHIFPPELYPFPMGEIIERWESFIDDSAVTVLVSDEDGAAVGVAGSRAEWLDGLYVLPEWWSTGSRARPARRGACTATRRRQDALQPLGAGGERPRAPLLRAARLARERRDACGAVPSASHRRRLLDRASGGIGGTSLGGEGGGFQSTAVVLPGPPTRRRRGSVAPSTRRRRRPSRRGFARCVGHAAST